MNLKLKEKLGQKLDEYRRVICDAFNLPSDSKFPEDHLEKIITKAKDSDIKRYIDFIDKQIDELHKTSKRE